MKVGMPHCDLKWEIPTESLSRILKDQNFIFALALTSTPRAKTIPVGLYDFVGDFYIDWGSMCAAALIATLPAILFIIFFQKYIVSGLLTGAIK